MEPMNKNSFTFRGEDLSQRIALIETRLDHHVQDFTKWFAALAGDVRELNKKLEALVINVAIIVDQKNEAEKRLSRWKNLGLTVCSGIAVALIGVLVKMAFIIQVNRLPPIGP